MTRSARLTALLTTIVLALGLLPASGAAAAPVATQPLPPDTFLSAMTGGNTVASLIREEEPRADGFRHLDTPAMIERLQQLNVTMYTYGVWDKATDWEDLTEEFAPAAQAAGIDIMVYIVPPSECFLRPEPHLDGRCSRPFNMDYVAWARAIAELSVEFPNVKSWGIDDFLSGPVNQALFTPEYLAEVRAAQDAVNPDLKWYVTLYHGEINPESMARIDGVLDGVIYPYNSIANTIDPTELEYRLDTALDVTQPAGQELVLLVYNGRFLDGTIHPDERYAAAVLDRAEPYVRDGRITGVIAYAGPMELDKHAPSWDFWGRSGNGSLSLSVSNHVSTASGSFAAASQVVSVDPAAATKTLSFSHRDPDEGGLPGYQFKQVLVNGEVVWNQDIVADAHDTWIDTTVDLTDALAGLTEATVTFRLFHQTGIGWWPHDLRIDDVTGSGLTVVNGGFETPSDWTLDRSGPNLQPYIDVYHPDRPTRVFNEISAGYARYQGLPFTPVRGGDWPSLRTSPENRAMYGNGRLEFTVPANTPVPAGTCASAWQRVDVEPGLPRYEIDFWHADPYQVKYDQYFKQIAIDGQVLWDRDAGDWWPWFYMQGSDHQGAIDVTEFVRGKDSVQLEFRFCTKNAVPELDIEYGVDAVRTIGLDLANGGFESDYGWTVQPAGPITAAVAVHGPCEAADATVLQGPVAGPVTVDGVTCLDDAVVTGPVDVRPGGSLYVSGGTVTGPIRSSGAVSVVMMGARVTGPVDIGGTTGEVDLDHVTITGPLRLTGNVTNGAPNRLVASAITGPLTCTGNDPAVTGARNDTRGPAGGECRNL
ncbi:polymer-forming cytoskeletal protein [Jiangella anatolica]|uniref:Uncharacterized protein n=1 Tax=Jiangella anatolica TaxID=2670374 RepID=A0A2W2BVK0_9ACTN|nr:polymer-forming cytoskeletal protein [Jiangella anatolica]PZF80189.1 hypothetical protein C1I92_27310 [Jiangella anatolica]